MGVCVVDGESIGPKIIESQKCQTRLYTQRNEKLLLVRDHYFGVEDGKKWWMRVIIDDAVLIWACEHSIVGDGMLVWGPVRDRW